ncbi:uncharacterized protein BBA_04774 [Beauveria bassiana ARSEF 2860]|uniref:Uncharacterized protein n=1 Tax=Beauveria bassiana (strain ARSEF 2860) TaxID=655819 RepID=J5JV05_BEAB2|nr:uncharacterized protein BBA_04774 [Beauveria bassiana ARSEF 2860]EJP66281.1 hypothetical protein BBA_04774 [Beauveria bassiana ARSEF 2860]
MSWVKFRVHQYDSLSHAVKDEGIRRVSLGLSDLILSLRKMKSSPSQDLIKRFLVRKVCMGPNQVMMVEKGQGSRDNAPPYADMVVLQGGKLSVSSIKSNAKNSHDWTDCGFLGG